MSYPKEICTNKKCKWVSVDKDYEKTVCEYTKDYDAATLDVTIPDDCWWINIVE